MSKSAYNGNGPSLCNGESASGQGPASVTVTGVRLGAGDTHWWRLV